ncbi:hypothetical protein DPMN_043352 [Dreissena polymorpha]|uniref:Uncharacterized protein n=1 Tax=Dreissena polymorpha TaxID=45954 RepID=A0A9D4HXR8_DREPO|nr:hypothetical protein DPMN_043352 [Dreissena polymorpha]
MSAQCKSLQKSLNDANKIIEDLQRRQLDFERQAIKNNLRLVGYHEKEGEHAEEAVKIVQSILETDSKRPDIVVENAYRVGKKQSGKVRQIVFRVRSFNHKLAIFSSRKTALDKRNYYITDDLTEFDREHISQLKPIIDQAMREKKNVKYRNGALFIDGQRYRGPIPAKSQNTGPTSRIEQSD